MKNITAVMNEGNAQSKNVQAPDKCPFCHHGIDPIIHFAYCNKTCWSDDECMQVVYRCTKKNCDNLFIAYYKSNGPNCDNFILSKIRPMDEKKREFADIIEEISSSFCTIYNQALSAEQSGLTEVCGVGYRKAFEFLIKDYLIKASPDKKEDIEKKFLGKCISEDIEMENIKAMAKRATWLGNDETHYLRKWEGKGLQDLKALIDVTIHWIEMEKITKDTIEDMPEEDKKPKTEKEPEKGK